MRTMLRGKFTLLFMTCAVILFVFPAMASAQSAPTIQSDKADYAPGELVTLTGSGWQDGESVNIVVNDDEGQTWNRNVNVTADASGNISDSFNLPDWFVATYSVKATGASGTVATTTFTDGDVSYSPSRVPTTGLQAVTAGTSFDFNATLSKLGGGANPVVNTPISVQNITSGPTADRTATACGTGTAGTVIPSSWVSVQSPSLPQTISGSTDFTFRVSPPANATSGTYIGSVTLATSTGNANNIDVCLNVSAAPTAAPTTLSVDPASGTYGGTTDLKAKLTKTSDSTNVSGKTITFSLRGTAVCDNDGTTPKPDCPTTGTDGVATLTGVSLSGINAGGPTGAGYAGAVSASFAGDSGFSASNGSNNLTVNKAPLTVTADDDSREYGEPNPNFTASYSGFKNGETLATSGVTGSPSLTTTATATSSVSGSPYTITAAAGNLASGNYSFSSFVNGELTITKAPLTVKANDATKILGAENPTFTASYSGFKNSETLATSGVTGAPSFTTTAITTSPIGDYPITPAVGTLSSGNYSFNYQNGTLKIQYAPATGTCLGSAGHTILQPINKASETDSTFKQGSTVPAKFRVCDANGNSIGTPGVVTSFNLVKTISGTESTTVNEEVLSTTPDTAFRWSSTDQQWIYNINTKKLTAGKTYVYQIKLNDGTTIDFQFGLK